MISFHDSSAQIIRITDVSIFLTSNVSLHFLKHKKLHRQHVSTKSKIKSTICHQCIVQKLKMKENYN